MVTLVPTASCLIPLLRNLSHHLPLLRTHLHTLHLLLLCSESIGFLRFQQFEPLHILEYHLYFILFFDLCLLLTLHKFLPGRHRLLLIVYWLSPILLLAIYTLGLNDIIPVFLLTFSVFLIRQIKLKIAGFFIAAAISAKLSMVIALPFIFIYLINNKQFDRASLYS